MDPSRRTVLVRGGLLAATLLFLPRRLAPAAPPGPEGSRPPAMATDSKELEHARSLLPTFKTTTSEHWVLLTDSSAEAQTRILLLLESTWREVIRFAGAIGAKVEAPPQKLLAILFSHCEDYRGFARKNDNFGETWALGHYSRVARRSAFAAPSSTPEYRKAIAELERVRSTSDPATTGGAVAVEQDKMNDWERAATIATTTHEAAHQVLFQTSVQSLNADYPAWLSEGLAASFETDRTLGTFGPDQELLSRRERFEKAMSSHALMPLEALVAMGSRPSSDALPVGRWYDQAASFVIWCFKQRRTEFVRYLSGHAGREAALTAAKRKEAFENAFGPIAALERAWLNDERSRAG